ncbi:MAG: coenzyme F420-0:L-glutamate ligase [Candidatus Hadarchaeum sp.]|uniref:coenzyme F420-0:L-glutamate ligase n=1 Tax=Candidatus Hadarchaeum sp. TaxID=2883567 RepID=UPI00317C451C
MLSVQLFAIIGIPMVKRGDDIGELIVAAAEKQHLRIEDGDVLAVAQTIISKAEGEIVDLRTITPSPRAIEIAKKIDKDPRMVEVILQQSSEIVRLGHVIITRTKQGFVCANAGVDRSNVDHEHVTVLPSDPDASAAKIRETVKKRLGVDIAVIITDTQGRPFRCGCIGLAIGVAGMKPLLDMRGWRDLYGKELKVTVTCPADSLAAAAVMIMGESNEGIPAVLIKGAKYEKGNGTICEVIRAPELDLFR